MFIWKGLFQERELEVNYDFIPGDRGTVDSYGAKYEPDWPDMVEIFTIQENNKEIGLSKEDFNKLEDCVIKAHLNMFESICDDDDDLQPL